MTDFLSLAFELGGLALVAAGIWVAFGIGPGLIAAGVALFVVGVLLDV